MRPVQYPPKSSFRWPSESNITLEMKNQKKNYPKNNFKLGFFVNVRLIWTLGGGSFGWPSGQSRAYSNIVDLSLRYTEWFANSRSINIFKPTGSLSGAGIVIGV